MSLVYRGVHDGTMDAAAVRELLDGITTTKVRLLGDRVSRGTAWGLANELGLDDTGDAEYLAVARLQADALVALDPRIAVLATGIVPVAAFDDLLSRLPDEVLLPIDQNGGMRFGLDADRLLPIDPAARAVAR